MYIPSSNKEDNFEALQSLMRAYNFATLITSDSGTPFATHAPFMLDSTRGPYGTLVGHIARAPIHNGNILPRRTKLWSCFKGPTPIFRPLGTQLILVCRPGITPWPMPTASLK